MITAVAGVVNLALITVIAAIKIVVSILFALILLPVALCLSDKENKYLLVRMNAIACLGEIARSVVDLTVIGAVVMHVFELNYPQKIKLIEIKNK